MGRALAASAPAGRAEFDPAAARQYPGLSEPKRAAMRPEKHTLKEKRGNAQPRERRPFRSRRKGRALTEIYTVCLRIYGERIMNFQNTIKITAVDQALGRMPPALAPQSQHETGQLKHHCNRIVGLKSPYPSRAT